MFGSTDFSATRRAIFLDQLDRHAAAEGLGLGAVVALLHGAHDMRDGRLPLQEQQLLCLQHCRGFLRAGHAGHDADIAAHGHDQLIVDRHDGTVAERDDRVLGIGRAVGAVVDGQLEPVEDAGELLLQVDQVGENPRLHRQLIAARIDGDPGGRVDRHRYAVDHIGYCNRAHRRLGGGAGNDTHREQCTQMKCFHAQPLPDDLSTQKTTQTQTSPAR